MARVSVHDEGIGIPVAEQQQVWERFAVVAGTTMQSGSGVSLGLGLHICKSIIEAHHGQVGLDSVPGPRLRVQANATRRDAPGALMLYRLLL